MFDGGRKLCVGDCALFQAGNAPPFIGIVRKLIPEKDTTKFSVNWLYRPADVKLAKGGPLEAAPNEIFYSFHKDEISAASLLHPCRVTFLRKGIDPPPGLHSYVCRRVYDTANKCLWWLTDRDYTDEHQDEVDQLLERTKLEMQAAVQSGGPSPRALIGGPTSSSQQIKAGSEATAQNATAYSAPNKSSKKRERADQNLEPSKRERATKSAEDGELSPLKRERSSMKPEEIASITDKDGGLLNPVAAERLVQLMQQDRNDGLRKAADVTSRHTLFASTVAATERDECLSRFVQMGGLPILDDWLQEAHKGKVGGEGGSPKEGDKGIEELLFTLLKALDKLPVDLDALKTCSVGKSVNHLRTHKSPEIQKKARKLVDIWKKRVDAEMKLSGEGKAGSNHGIWSSYKQNSPDILHSHHLMKSGGPTEVAVKSSGAFAGSAKPMPNGTASVDGIPKASPVSSVGKMGSMMATSSPTPIKREEGNSSTNNSKLTAPANAGTGGGGAVPVSGDSPLSSVKEEKGMNAAAAQQQNQQPQSNGQAATWGNGLQVKGVASAGGSTWKEDVKNASMGGSLSSKSLGAGSRHPGLAGKGGLLQANLSGSTKDLLAGKPLVWSRSAAVADKMGSSPTASSSDKVPPPEGTASARESPSNSQQQQHHRSITRTQNPGRSPARMGSAGVGLVVSAAFDQGLQAANRVLSPSSAAERSSSASLDAAAAAAAAAISDVKGGRTQNNGSLPVTSSDPNNSDVKSSGGGNGRLGGPVEDEREKFGSSSAHVDGLMDGEKRVAGEPMRAEQPERSSVVKDLSDHQNGAGTGGGGGGGGMFGFARRSDPSDSAAGHENCKKVGVDVSAGGVPSVEGNSDATAMEVDEVGISLLASVAAGEMRRTVGSSGSEAPNPDLHRIHQAEEGNVTEQGRQQQLTGSSDSTTISQHLKDVSGAAVATTASQQQQQVEKEGGDSDEQMEAATSGQEVVGSANNNAVGARADEVSAEQGGDGGGIGSAAGKQQPSDSESSKKEGPGEGLQHQDHLPSIAEGEGKDSEKGQYFTTQESKGRLLEIAAAGSGVVKSAQDRKADDNIFKEEPLVDSMSPRVGGGAANVPFNKDMKVSAMDGSSGVSSNIDSHNNIGNTGSKSAKESSSDERKGAAQGKGIELCNGYGSPANELKLNNHQVASGSAAGSSGERQDRTMATRDAGEADISRSSGAGISGERKGGVPPASVSVSMTEAMEAAMDGAQELKRRMDMRGVGRVPSFHGMPNLAVPQPPSIAAASAAGGAAAVPGGPGPPPPQHQQQQQHGKPSQRPSAAGEPATPEQAAENAGPTDEVAGGSGSGSGSGGSDGGSERPDFDLNEHFAEEANIDDSTSPHSIPLTPSAAAAAAAIVAASATPTAPVAIVTATKGGFVLPASPLRTKSELGWKGSAATSAFRPAEPRRTPDRQVSAGVDILAPELPSQPNISNNNIPAAAAATATVAAKKGGRGLPLDLNIDLNELDYRNIDDGIITSAAAVALAAASDVQQQPSFADGPVVPQLPMLPPLTTNTASSAGAAVPAAFRGDHSSSGMTVQSPSFQRTGSSTARPFLDLNIFDDSEENGGLGDTDATTAGAGRLPLEAMIPQAMISLHPSVVGVPQGMVPSGMIPHPLLPLPQARGPPHSMAVATPIPHPLAPPPRSSNNHPSAGVHQQVTRRSVVRDFDLNDGPLAEEVATEEQPPVLPPSLASRAGPGGASIPSAAAAGPAGPGPLSRRGAEVMNNSSPWFGPNASFKPTAIPDFTSSSRAESPYSVAAAAAAQSYLSAGAAGGVSPFNAEMYRSSLPSSAAPPPAAFPSGNHGGGGGPYAYPGFPVAAGFPFTSTGGATFAPPNHVAPYLDSTGVMNFRMAASPNGPIPTQQQLPRSPAPPSYLMGLPEVAAPPSVPDNGANGGGWATAGRPRLDLNSGPEPVDGDGGREEMMGSRPAAGANSMVVGGGGQPPSLDQMRVFRQVVNVAGPPVGGGGGAPPPLKRKEPENGWEMNRSTGGYKQQAWR